MTNQTPLSSFSRHFGIDISPTAGLVVEETKLSAPPIPFIGSALVGKKVNRLHLTDLADIRLDPRSPYYLGYVTDFIITLDSDSNQLLNIVSSWPDRVPPIAPYPTIDEEEKQYKAVGETIVGLPSYLPNVTFLQALKVIDRFEGKLVSVKQIFANLVIHDTLRYSGRCVWLIQLRGLKPFPLDLPLGTQPLTAEQEKLTADSRNHLRFAIDADTGEWLSADTVPQPTKKV